MGTESESFRLDADASGLIRALEQATAGFLDFDAATARIERSVADLSVQGDVLARSVTAIDAAGNRATVVIRQLDDALDVSIRAIEGAAAAQTQLVGSSRLAAQAAQLLRDAVTSSTSVYERAVAQTTNLTTSNRNLQASFIAAAAAGAALRNELGGVAPTPRRTGTDDSGQQTRAQLQARVAALREAATAELAELKRVQAEREKDQIERLRFIDRERAARLLAIQQERAAEETAQAERLLFIERYKARQLAAIREEQAVRETAIRTEQAARLQTRIPGIDFRTIQEGGRATEQQVLAFRNAELAARRLVATSTVGSREMAVAIDQARAGTLRLADANTVAQQAALRLVAAERQVAAGAQQAIFQADNLVASIRNLGTLVGISLLIGGAFRLVSAFTEAAEAAGEFSIAIAEIETITKDNSFATEEWAEGLRALSNEFGIDTITQAEGAYQILSNQIRNAAGEAINGAEALEFLRVANQLAITGVTDTASATNLLTSVINSFGLAAEDAGIVSAQLFKVVELGRLRIEDMSESFGRLSVPANQLGLDLAEVGGAIAQATIQGVRFNEASTLIRNVILKLIRPTNQMKEVFAELGVASGEALIASRGFVGALEAIESRVGGTSTELGEAFGRIRAITGALIFAGDGATETAEKIAEIREATVEAFSADTNRIIESTGQQLAIAGEQARNFFEREIGTPAIEAINNFIQAQGGMTEVIEQTVDALTSLGKVLAIVYGAKTLRAIGSFTVAQIAAAGAVETATRATVAFNTALASTPVGVALVIGGSFAALTEILKNQTRETLREVERQNLAIEKANKDRNNRLLSLERAATQQVNLEIDRRVQGILRGFADARAELTRTSQQLENEAVNLASRFDDSIRNFTKTVNAQLTAASKSVRDFNKDVEDAAEQTQEILNQAATVSLQVDLDTAGVGQRIDILNDEILRAQDDLNKSASEGNLELFEDQRKRVNDLLKQRTEAELELARQTSRIESELTQERARRSLARSREERRLADDRIATLQRELEIAQNGTAQQLDLEKRLQEAREQIRVADTQEEFKTALENLNNLQSEQERLNRLAEEERRIHQATSDALIQQAELSERIRQIQEERSKEAQAEEARVRSLQFLFNLISQEAEDFNNKRIIEGKNAEEINKAVAEQQARFAQLITLSRELSGSRANDTIFIQRDTQLRAQAEEKIRKIRNDERQEAIKFRANDAKAAIENIRAEKGLQDDLFASILERIEALRDASSAIAPARALTFDGGPGIQQSRGDIAALAFNQIEELNARNTQSIESTLNLIRDLTKQIIALIADQRLEPTVERGQLIQAQANILRAALQNVEARQQAGGPRPNIRFAAQDEETRKRINALRESITPAVGAFTQLDTVLQKLLKNDGLINSLSRSIEETTNVETRDPLSAEELRRIALQGLSPEETARALIGQLNELATAPEQPTGVPEQVQPVDVQTILPDVEGVLSEETANGLRQGLENAAPQVRQLAREAGQEQGRASADESIRQAPAIGAVIGQEQAKANAEEAQRQAPSLQDRINQLRADGERRLAQIREAEVRRQRRPDPTAPDVDTTIRFGPGQPSVRDQELRIQQELNELGEQRLNTLRAELEEERRLQAIKAEEARAAGQVFTNAQGELVTRQATSAEREAAVAEPQIDEAEQQRALDALRLARGGGAEEIARIEEELKNARAEELSEIQANLDVAHELGIEDERALELARDQNNISQAARDATAGFVREIEDVIASRTIQPGLQERPNVRDEFGAAVAATGENVAEGANKIEEANRKLQESLDQLRLTIINGQVQEPTGFAQGGRVFGPGGIDKVSAMLTAGEYVVNARQTAKFLPTLEAINAGRIQPKGFQDGGIVNNMGGIRVTVNESSSPQATAKEVVAQINRGIRNGSIKIRRN